MDEMKKTDKLFLILHRAGWSISDTSFLRKKGSLGWSLAPTAITRFMQTERPMKRLGDRLAARLRRWGWFSRMIEED